MKRAAGRPPSRRRDRALWGVIRQLGGVSNVASHLGISVAAVSLWRRIPEQHLTAIEKLTGIKRAALRPDLAPKSARGKHGKA
jgi:DNA-binding transcriptional regulator YdaS (Cro superfamily)